jgi:hypothetical protein
MISLQSVGDVKEKWPLYPARYLDALAGDNPKPPRTFRAR